MYAVIKTGGKQYRVSEGDTIRVEKLTAEEGATIEFEQVLALGDGEEVQLGAPYVEGGKVAATVKSHGRHKKIMVIKFKRRKSYLRRQGHRQGFTELQIIKIGAEKAE